MSVKPDSVTVSLGDSVQFTASEVLCDAVATSPAFYWSSTNPSRMTVDSLSGVGIARDTGTVLIVGTSALNSAVAGVSTVTVRP